MKILILHPDFKDPGGVAAYYRKLEGKFSMPVTHLTIGTRPGERGAFAKAIRQFRDMGRFLSEIGSEEDTIVHVNPSLDPKSLVRDGLFVLWGKSKGKKTLVFFRGWSGPHEMRIQRYGRWLFRFVFGRADSFIVLASSFENKLKQWVDGKPIYKEFTTLDDNDLLGFDMMQAVTSRLATKPWQILFMSRLLKKKGVYEAIDTIGLLSRQGLPVRLSIAGDGPELIPARQYARGQGLTNIEFLGYLRGEEKLRVMRESHLFFFPTSHTEGMPNAVAEAMGFGLPVVTRPVGGVADFFLNGVHGFSTMNNEPQEYARLILRIIEDETLYSDIALKNYQFACNHFKASETARRLEKIYMDLFVPEGSEKKIYGLKPGLPAARVQDDGGIAAGAKNEVAGL